MAEILLTTLNAKYIHAAFGLRYLMANLGLLQPRACLIEFDINQRPLDIAEVLLAQNPKIIGFGVYIWNVALTTEIFAALKRIRPEIILIAGGPEVSFDTETQPITALADYVICGEADLKFAEVCRQILDASPPPTRIIAAELPQFAQLELPYRLYNDDDIAHRIIYVEASRGCPFTCEFCLSSLDIPVRQAPLPLLLGHLQHLLNRGVRQFKFVDRTFNLNLKVSETILQFFLERYQPGHFFHFEMIPDRLPDGLRALIARFPAGALQFEIGIQTFNPEVGALIQRRQNYDRLAANFEFLRRQTSVHLHADLIVGLPGESLESFAAGFDRLIALAPQEIQVGLLKRLRGTPISRHDADWEMVYNPHPPYEILRTKLIDFLSMQKLRRFARYWDLLGNSGNFVETTPLLWSNVGSPFAGFMRWSEWLHARIGKADGIALPRLMQLVFEYLTEQLKRECRPVAEALCRDYRRAGRTDLPPFLKAALPEDAVRAYPQAARTGPRLPKRQARHSAGAQRLPARGTS